MGELALVRRGLLTLRFERLLDRLELRVAVNSLVDGVVLSTGPCGRDPLAFSRKEAICSAFWRERFEDPVVWPRVLRAEPFAFVEQARACSGFGPPAGEWQHPDLNNEIVTLQVEAMSNTYRTFVLVWLPRRERFKRRRVMASAA